MSRKQRNARRRTDHAPSEHLQSVLNAQPVGELSKFWSSAGTTFIISGLLGIMMLTLDHCQGRAAERLRTTSEAVAARRDALEDFGARLHGIVEAHYDALLAEQAWQAQRARIDPTEACRIEMQTTLGFAKKLVECTPPLRRGGFGGASPCRTPVRRLPRQARPRHQGGLGPGAVRRAHVAPADAVVARDRCGSRHRAARSRERERSSRSRRGGRRIVVRRAFGGDSAGRLRDHPCSSTRPTRVGRP
ncbi:MAG: hypothetical protein RL580_1059 [Pseudomonadota bacterium]